MTDRTKRLLSLMVSLALGGGLLWLALRNADLEAVGAALADGEWGWMVPFVGLGLLSVVIRAWRWGLLIDALPGRTDRVPLRLTSASVAIGYLVNYAAPRLGEVARTAHVSRRAEAPFSAVLGTVVAERVLDVIMLALALLSVVVLFGDRVRAILEEAWDGIVEVLTVPAWVWVLVVLVAVALVVAAVVVVRRGQRIGALLAQFRDGLASVGRTGRPGAVVLSTLLLWACYGLMSDLPLRLLGLDAAYGLGPVEAWAVMAVGGIGMALPSPGGTGSFHYATVQALTLLFGVAVTPAATYALLVHAAGVVFYCLLGVVALTVQGTSLGALRSAAAARA
ncbi:lysylphosphatidylglycerol synthase transmembrane domain-containing protein [Rubrivirga sp.]|uniref:lysylphosphatidylglycerol synthase transmembrane domain-containing protein n=1 Tax=Rubrivirga sp. TaxID=1885344 RepID=UPI003B526599